MAYEISAASFRGDFIVLRNKPPPVVERKAVRIREILKTKTKHTLYFVIILHSDQLKPKSHLKIINKYLFSESEQYPSSQNKCFLLVSNRTLA